MNRTLFIILLSAMLTFYSTAQGSEASAPNTSVATAEQKNKKSKSPEKKSPEFKKVCTTVWDATLRKEVKKCRTVKIYKKHNGTPIPKR